MKQLKLNLKGPYMTRDEMQEECQRILLRLDKHGWWIDSWLPMQIDSLLREHNTD